MASGAAKVALFDAFASVAQALGSGRRSEIVDILAQGERSVEEIASEISQSVANTSQHLRVLARAGLVRSRREGTRIFYRLASERVGDLWAAVREVAVRHVAEVGLHQLVCFAGVPGQHGAGDRHVVVGDHRVHVARIGHAHELVRDDLPDGLQHQFQHPVVGEGAEDGVELRPRSDELGQFLVALVVLPCERRHRVAHASSVGLPRPNRNVPV